MLNSFMIWFFITQIKSCVLRFFLFLCGVNLLDDLLINFDGSIKDDVAVVIWLNRLAFFVQFDSDLRAEFTKGFGID